MQEVEKASDWICTKSWMGFRMKQWCLQATSMAMKSSLHASKFLHEDLWLLDYSGFSGPMTVPLSSSDFNMEPIFLFKTTVRTCNSSCSHFHGCSISHQWVLTRPSVLRLHVIQFPPKMDENWWRNELLN